MTFRVVVSDTRTYLIDADSANDAIYQAQERFVNAKHKVECSIPLTPCQATNSCPYEKDLSWDCGKCYTKYVKGGFKG